jgi:DNA-binding GntR family transcriptional regulator
MSEPWERSPPLDLDDALNTGRRATDEAITFIRGGILSGRLPAGSRLNAAQISAELGVTIVPVREAIHFLAGAGLIELLALKGARVCSFDRDEVIGWWRIFQALTEIELASAARRISEAAENMQIIRDAQARIETSSSSSDPQALLNALADFHLALNRVSGERLVREASRRLQARFWTLRLVDHIPLPDYGPQFATHYGRIADALLRGDGATAIASFAYQVAWSSALIRGERPKPGQAWIPPGL